MLKIIGFFKCIKVSYIYGVAKCIKRAVWPKLLDLEEFKNWNKQIRKKRNELNN